LISKNQFGCENGAGVRDSGNSWNFGRGTNQYSCCDCANGFICRNVSCAVPRPSRQKPAVIPKQAIILLSGVPATGKSAFARHLARECGFAHYDLECHPRGWPHPELKATWTPAVQDLWRNCANITSASYLTGDSLPLLSLGSRNCGEAERNSSGLMATLPVHSRFLCSAADRGGTF